MKVSPQTWNDLLTTPNVQSVESIKYTENEWLNELIQFVINGSYDRLFIENAILRDLPSKTRDDSQWVEVLKKLNNDQELVDLLHSIIGIAYLQLFIINNFVGPKLELDNSQQSLPQTTVNELLTCDGEAPVSAIECLDYLFQATKVFQTERSESNIHWTYYWWTMRTLFTHQKMIEERSMTLCDHLQICIDKLLTCQSEMNKTQQILFFIEMAYVSQYYCNWKQVETARNRALELSGLEINLTGQLGKRTRYQINNTSQLLLDITRKELQQTSTNTNQTDEETPTLPKDLALTDDVVLNQIQFENGSDHQNLTVQLNIIEQLTLLLIISDRQVNNPRHEINTEEQLAFLTYILARPTHWCVQTCSLIFRCHHETENKRKIERTLLQLQELLDQYDYKTPSSAFRLEHFHSTPYSPTWQLKSNIAHIYVKLGLVNNALDLYLYLKKWSDVITCYQILKKLSLAEHIIREQLKIKETPDLLCSLGEVTDELEYFQRAWILSKERNGRAQRLMGKYYFNRGNYEKACEHLLKAVEINSLQHDLWFWLGSAAFRTEKWEIGARAYNRCTNIEPDNFEAWNNLAACHTKLKQKDKAHKVFIEAIKCNYDNWKVWENFLWTSADCGEIDDVIQAYHRLIDLKTKYIDKEVLQRLVHLLSNNDRNEMWTKIYQKSLELFGRLTSQVTNDADIWEFYSDLYQLKTDEKSVDWCIKILQQLQRAHRCSVSQASGWENEVNSINNVLRLSDKLANTTIANLGEHQENENYKQLCHSIRLALNSVLTRLKQKYDSSLFTTDETMTSNVHDLEKSLSQLTDMLLTK